MRWQRARPGASQIFASHWVGDRPFNTAPAKPTLVCNMHFIKILLANIRDNIKCVSCNVFRVTAVRKLQSKHWAGKLIPIPPLTLSPCVSGLLLLHSHLWSDKWTPVNSFAHTLTVLMCSPTLPRSTCVSPSHSSYIVMRAGKRVDVCVWQWQHSAYPPPTCPNMARAIVQTT